MKVLRTIGTLAIGATAGFVACGVLTIRGVLKSERQRQALSDMVTEKVSEWLFNEKTDTSRVSYYHMNDNKKSPRSRVSYRSPYHYAEKRDRMNAERGPIEIKFDNGAEADTAFDHIKELMVEYGQVTVADVCDICELPSCYEDNNYGWTHASDMHILEGGGEYTLCLPKPLPLK